MKQNKRIVIVGAGVAGLACARRLVDHGLTVKVFEKSDRPGGRCTSTSTLMGDYDHGAQYFTARNNEFQEVVSALINQKSVDKLTFDVKKISSEKQLTNLPSENRFVGIPNMGVVAEKLSVNLPVQYSSEVVSLSYQEGTWDIVFLKGGVTNLMRADILILAMPIDQILNLNASERFKASVGDFRMNPCWAVMIAFNRTVPVEYSALLINDKNAPISWIMRDSAKNHRQGFERWVLHSGPKWAKANIDLSPAVVTDLLTDEFSLLTKASSPIFAQSKLWRFASGGRHNDYHCLIDHERSVIGCGDWASGGRIEGAWISGKNTADFILEELDFLK